MSVLHNPLPDPIHGLPLPSTAVSDRPACRCCGSHHTRSRGKLPDARVFAGTQLDEPLAGGTLYRCLDCRLAFRHPVFSKETYDELYRQASSTTWDEAGRLDQQLVRETLCELLDKGSVLDIGCGTGSLLAPLSGRFHTFGIEINPDAAAVAEQRGVKIIAGDLDELSAVPEEFDAVIACDVIEHVFNPLELVQRMLAKTAPGGYVVISTGNSDAWSWYLAGSRFWYCYLPEHISFVSPAWFRRNAAQLNVQVTSVREFTYSPHFPLMGKTLRLALMGLFRLSPDLYYRLLPRIKRNNIPVGRGITQDHFIVVLQKQRTSLQ
jgi:2-polyprenyl-3-methyl-5-hydroxy-6-metoxy-1,4-benzoquinol methylase